MALVVADTDVLIDFMANVDPSAAEISRLLSQGDLATTVVSRFELFVGAKTTKQQKIVQELLYSITNLQLDSSAADTAAGIQRTLSMRGNPIGMADSLIAGIVQSKDAELFTRNTKHFERIEGLKLFQYR